MARYLFRENKEFAARLHAVWEKPLENKTLRLIRLEFEIFQILDSRQLSSTGKIACRDIVVGRGADLTGDAGVQPYLIALKVISPHRPASWLGLVEQKPWVKIVFGPVAKQDQRNDFASLFPFDATGREISEYDYDLDVDWMMVSQAAAALKLSASTIIRRVKENEPEFGIRLVRRTNGGHRRINLRLLQNLF